MSTRAMYTFKDNTGDQPYHVYKHHDGYPTGAAQWIIAALPLTWELPRYEADEFAAAFVAANKDQPGGVRLMHSGDVRDVAPGDIEYRYEIAPGNDSTLRVKAYSVENWEVYNEGLILDCTLLEFETKAAALEEGRKTVAPLYKTTIVIWTDYDPVEMELNDLAREATNGDAFCSKQHIEHIADPQNDCDAPNQDFFLTATMGERQ